VERVWQSLGANDAVAWLGPCIGPEAFEVGDEVKAAFEAHDAQAGRLFKPHAPGKWLADLPGLARMRLQALGVTRVYGNDSTREWCTVSNPSRFFSHRRDRVSGRFAAGIWLV
jgi:polyphenol oxidase